MARHGSSRLLFNDLTAWLCFKNGFALENIIISHAIFILDSRSNIGTKKYFVYLNTFFVGYFCKRIQMNKQIDV